jgi:hypothetical protein
MMLSVRTVGPAIGPTARQAPWQDHAHRGLAPSPCAPSRQEPAVSPMVELIATTLAAAAGALIAVVAVGASMLLVVPVTLGVGVVAAITSRRD